MFGRKKKSQETVLRLLKKAAKGDQRAQRKFYESFYGYSMSVALRFSANREEAMEVVHDAFIKAFEKYDSVKSEESFKPWFRRVVVNSAIDLYRKNQAQYSNMSLEVTDDIAVEDNVLNKMGAEEILKLVAQLSPSYRMVFSLYAIEGFKHEEIAKKLGISVGTSKSNLAKARTNLKVSIIKSNPSYKDKYG